jgi:transcriptional regulator with XRE-family HTH domain
MSRKTSPEKQREVCAHAQRGISHREISKITGVSTGAISTILAGARQDIATARRAAIAVGRPVTERNSEFVEAARRDRLFKQAVAGRDRLDRRDGCLAFLRHEYSDFARHIDEGATLTEALSSLYDADVLLFLALYVDNPSDFAELVTFIADDDDEYGREDGETDAQYRAFLRKHRKAAHTRAVALLEGALAIVRKAAP